MKWASSIRYGGELIDAADCDYQDHKQLGLLCPNCKSPVFLQGQSSRTLTNKVVEIPPHFKHFAAKDPALIKQCEVRVAKYDKKELERRAASSRNQRLKLLQRCFWQTLLDKAPCINSPGSFGKEEMLRRMDSLFTGEAEIVVPANFTNIYHLVQPENFRDWFIWADRSKNHLQTHIQNYLNDPPEGDWSRTIESLKTQLDIKLHRLILMEIVDFLYTRSSAHVLRNCLLFAFVRVTSAGPEVLTWFLEQVRDGYKPSSPLLCGLAMELVTIPWAEEFERLQKGNIL